MPPPLLSPYDTIHEDLALYKTKTHSDPTDQFFSTMKNLKSLLGTTSAISRLVLMFCMQLYKRTKLSM
jgi:hypothetical protein